MSLIPPDPSNVPSIPPIDDSNPVLLSERWREIQKIASTRPLTQEETVEAVQITRALRRTNTGPARPKTSRAKAPKVAISLDDILGD